jgi:hypothetical protein
MLDLNCVTVVGVSERGITELKLKVSVELTSYVTDVNSSHILLGGMEEF